MDKNKSRQRHDIFDNMARVLVIIGSPRKIGNSFKIVKLIEERIKTHGGVEFSYLFLRDAHLELCRGCGLCLSVGDERCPLKDDREAIEKQMLESDGVIFVSPVYVMNITAMMKNFLDRFAYTFHRPRFFSQKAMIVCTTGALGLKEAIDRLSVVEYAGFDLVHKAGFITPESNVSLKAKRKMDKEIDLAAMKFFEALHSSHPRSPKLTKIIAFRSQQAAFAASHEYDRAQSDYDYFKENGWLEGSRQYYMDVRINPIKNLIAILIGKMVRRKTLEDLQGVPWNP
jgi:multimeric flavodoxin WrbA